MLRKDKEQHESPQGELRCSGRISNNTNLHRGELRCSGKIRSNTNLHRRELSCSGRIINTRNSTGVNSGAPEG